MSSDTTSFDQYLTFKIPFETIEQANIALGSLKPDPILKYNELKVDYSTDPETCELIIKFNGVSDRVIRVAANNVMENLKTVVECFEEFDGNKGKIF